MHVKPPEEYNGAAPKVFLAGSIEQGAAVEWQEQVAKTLEGRYVVLNPRRDDWDSTWEQSRDNENFVEQVEWELRHISIADIVLFYFQAGTKSPISIGEFYFLLSHFSIGQCKMVVYVEEGFWRKGNIDVMCDIYGVPQVDSLLGLSEYAWHYAAQV